MKITPPGATPSAKGALEYFTGDVRIDCPFCGSGDLSAATVTFEPDARTVWHTHPLGQTLLVTSGFGLVGYEGGRVQEIRPGNIVWIEPGEKHWHGASAKCAMSHVVICEMKDGKGVDWMEHVTDAEYNAK